MNKEILGAEGKIIFLEDKVIKERIPKGYRHPSLDKKLRVERNKMEAKILKYLYEHRIPVPKIIEVKEHIIVMEKINGTPLLEVNSNLNRYASILGEIVAKMHNLNVIHGDLTLRNVLVVDNNDLYLVDFGLAYFSSRYEDKGTDIYVLEETSKNTPFPLDAFYESYFSNVIHAEEIRNRLERIRRRRRYLGSSN